MRKFSLVTSLMVMLLVLSLVLSGCGTASVQNTSTDKSESKEPYKIGLLTTLSGPLAYLGTAIRDAAQIEVEQINTAGGINGHPIEMIIEDAGTDPAKAVTLFNKLVQQDKVLVVTGNLISALEAALRPVADRSQVPFVVLNPNGPDRRGKNDKYVFNIAPSELARAGNWIDILKAKGLTKVVGLSANDSFAITSLDELKKGAVAQGISVDVLPDLIDMKAIDHTPLVAKLKDLIAKNKAQAVVTTCWTASIPGVLKTMKQMGVDIPVIGFDAMADPALLEMSGDELNGLITPGFKVLAGETLADNDPQKALVIDFNKRYTAKSGKVAGTVPGLSYDSIGIIANALKVAGADREKIREAIEKTTNLVGVIGIYNYSANNHEGLTKESLAVYEVKDKKFTLLKDIFKK